MLKNWLSYKKKAERSFAIYLDRPISSMDLALFGIERTIRGTTKSLRFKQRKFYRKGMYISSLKFLHFDLVAIILIFVFLI